MLLVLVKNLLFHLVCLRREERYLALKGRIMLAISRLGGYERRSMRLLPLLARPGSDVVDAGANFGAYTLGLARTVGPSGRVFAFEPIPSVAARLERACHGFGNVTVLREILSDRAAATLAMRVPMLPGGVPEPALATVEDPVDERASRPSWAVLQLHSSRLDDHLARFRDVSFMKVDVEGHEAALLSGATHTIQAFRPIVQIESAGLARHEAAVRTWMAHHDYRLFGLKGRRLAAAEWGGTLSLNVYLVPRESVARLPQALVRAGHGSP